MIQLSTLRGKAAAAIAVIACAIIGLTACNSHPDGSERQLLAALDSFTVSYYNWQYHLAQHFCTPESETWLRFAASQVTQEDIELLRSRDAQATYELQAIDYADDTTAYASITVSDFLQADSIGRQPRHVDKADFRLRLVLPATEKKWKVDLTQLPRPEKSKP